MALFWGQKITWVFSNLRVFTFYKSMMGCLNWYLLLKIVEFYRPEWIKRGTTWKWILTISKYKNECYKQGGKNRWKNEFFYLVFMFPSLAVVLNVSRKVRFQQFCADFSKKSTRVKAIYILHLKVLTTLFQNGMVYRGLSNPVWDISN